MRREGGRPVVTRKRVAGAGALFALSLGFGVVAVLVAAAGAFDWWDLIPLVFYIMGAGIGIVGIGTLVEIVR